MKKLQVSIISIFILVLLRVPFSQGQDLEPKELIDLRNTYNADLQKSIKPVNDRYLPKLEELKKQLTFRGNIKDAVAVDEETQRISQNMPLGQQKASDPQELTEIKKVYGTEIDTAMKPITSLYLAKLEVLKQQLAQGGNLKGALAVEQEAAKYTQTVKREDPILGKWSWFNGDLHTFLPEGKVAGDPNSTWTLLDKDRKLYRIIWGGRWIDTVTMSADGRGLTGTNQDGTRITGNRIQ